MPFDYGLDGNRVNREAGEEYTVLNVAYQSGLNVCPRCGCSWVVLPDNSYRDAEIMLGEKDPYFYIYSRRKELAEEAHCYVCHLTATWCWLDMPWISPLWDKPDRVFSQEERVLIRDLLAE